MTDKHILHMLTPLKHMSPFDVNMALDAGYDAAIAYTNVMLDEVGGLVQDAIFSRPPKTGVRTGMFIGGKNAILALDMLSAAKKALVPPFGISFFADPAGSFTTAAAMVACVEKSLLDKKKRSLKDLKLAVFGATGVVGFSSAVIAALEGADVTLVGYDGTKRVSEAAGEPASRSTSMSPMAATIRRRRRSWQRPRPHSARDARACAFSRAPNLPKRSVF
jgi:methylene-tetrahydromethanopterin dehydrogenase